MDKVCAAEFYHVNARRLLEAGDRNEGAVAVNAAVETFPECREAILLDRSSAPSLRTAGGSESIRATNWRMC
jgi:hypothetical protein